MSPSGSGAIDALFSCIVDIKVFCSVRETKYKTVSTGTEEEAGIIMRSAVQIKSDNWKCQGESSALFFWKKDASTLDHIDPVDEFLDKNYIKKK